jgi:predicted PhzF superfamily epimerase YddE/YHI9
LPFLHVQFEREADVEEARGNPGGVRALLGKTKEACGYEASGIYAFYAERAEEGNERGADLRVHARMFYTDFGEDSATGSAAVRSVSSSSLILVRRQACGIV